MLSFFCQTKAITLSGFYRMTYFKQGQSKVILLDFKLCLFLRVCGTSGRCTRNSRPVGKISKIYFGFGRILGSVKKYGKFWFKFKFRIWVQNLVQDFRVKLSQNIGSYVNFRSKLRLTANPLNSI